MIRIHGYKDSIHFGEIYCNGVPVVKEIEIENISQYDIIIEPKFISRRKGLELIFENDNPDSILKDCSFSQYPIYRYAKRPSELNEYLYSVDKIDINKGERKKFLLILSVTDQFLNEIDNEENISSGERESRYLTELYESLNDASVQFHCFSTYPSIQLYDCSCNLSFFTCRSKLCISTKTIYMNDMHVGLLYERQVEITNLSPFPTSFSFESLHTNNYVCSVFVPVNNTHEILIKPRILESNESMTVTIRMQPLQPGYHEIHLRLINESYCNQSTVLTIFSITAKAIKQQDIFLSESPGKFINRSDRVLDFGGCFEGKTVRKELFITNESEYDVYVKPRSSRKDEIRFTAKPIPTPADETPSQKNSISSEIDLMTAKPEPTMSDDETMDGTKEKDIHEICVMAHSSFRICILYTPKCRASHSSLRLEEQSFFLLFELHSLKDYGEISLFCTSATCGCSVTVTESIRFDNCISDEEHEKTMELTNYCDLDCEVIVACAASSLSFPSIQQVSLSLSEIQQIEETIHQQVASVAYSVIIPKNSTITLPVVYYAKTRQRDYSNYIAIYSLNSDPVQCLTCQIYAQINQSETSLFNAFDIELPTEASQEQPSVIHFGKVVQGAITLKHLLIRNNKSFPISLTMKTSPMITPFAIPAGVERLIKLDQDQLYDDPRKKVMNNLNLDTTQQHETIFNMITSPITPQDQCFSPIPRDHRREKSDSFCLDEVKSDTENDSFMADSSRASVNEHSFDLPIQEFQRYRSQSQIDPSLLIGNDLPLYQDSIVLDINQPEEVLKWFTLQSDISLMDQRRMKYSIIKRLKEHAINDCNSFVLEGNQSVHIYLRYQNKLAQTSNEETYTLTFFCKHPLMEVTTPPSLFSNFSMESHTQWNSIPVSPIEMDDSKNLDSPISAPFLPLKKSGSMRNQQLLELPPSIVTGSSHKNTFSDLSFHENTNNMYKQDIEMHVENIHCELSSPQTHLYFGRLYTKTRHHKQIRIFNNSCVDIPLLIRQSINYNLGQTKEEQELIIPAFGENMMNISIEPSVVGNYKGSIVVINLLNWTKVLHFLLKAVICQEIAFTILSPVPITLGSFLLNEKGKGIIKIQNTANRDLQYTISKNKLELRIQDGEGDDFCNIGYKPLIEIRRSGKISNSLSSNEREHLESSKEKLLRDIRVCKRKGRRRAQEALEKRLENVIKRLNEDTQINPFENEVNLERFEETHSVQILLEPDYSSVLFVNMKITPISGFAPAVSQLFLTGTVNVSRNSNSSQEIPLNGVVQIPYVPANSAVMQKTKLQDLLIPFSVHYQNTTIHTLNSNVKTLLFDNKKDSEALYFVLKNEIFDNLKIDILWNNISNISPEFGEIRFRSKELNPSTKQTYVNDIHEQVTRTSSSSKLSLVLSAKEAVEISVIWKVGKKFKLLNQIISDTLLGYITIVPKRKNCMLLNIPASFTPIRSHLIMFHSVISLGEFAFDHVYPLKLILQNTSDEIMDITTKPCPLLPTPIEEVLKPREKKSIALDLSLSARVITNNMVSCPIVFYSPSNADNQASCVIKATVTNPYIVHFPQLQRSKDGKNYVMRLEDCWFPSIHEEEAYTVTPLVVKNLRDRDIVIDVQDTANRFSLVNDKQEEVKHVCIPLHTEVTVLVRCAVINRFNQQEGKLSRFINGTFSIQGSCYPATREEGETQNEEAFLQPLFHEYIHYTCKVGVIRYSIQQDVFHISNYRPIQNHTFDFEIVNKNPGLPFPFIIQVQQLSNPNIQVILSKSEGLIEKSISINVSVTCTIPGYSFFSLKISHSTGIVPKTIFVNLFNRNNYISIVPSNPQQEIQSFTASIDMGNIAVTKYGNSPYFAINPAGSNKFFIQLTNMGSISAFLIPYSNFPVQIEEGDTVSSNEGDSPMSVHRTTSLDGIPSFLLDENATLPSLLESEMNYSICGQCMEVLPGQTVELMLCMKPRAFISQKMSRKLDKEKYGRKLPFSGNICFFSSRGDNLFQQLMNIEGVFYQEHIQISSQMADFGIIFANTTRYPRLDIRIDNLSCSDVTINLSKLPRGFTPSMYYLFSQHHAGQSLQQYSIDHENGASTMLIEKDCYASLILDLDMKVLEWVEGKNAWDLHFSTLSSPDNDVVFHISGDILSSVLQVVQDSHPLEELKWDHIPFPSLEDQITEVEIVNSSPKEAHVQIVFHQTQYKQVMNMEIVPNTFKLGPKESKRVQLIQHAITIYSLSGDLSEAMKKMSLVGELQVFADCNVKSQKDVTRTLTDIPVHMAFTFNQVLSVFPPLVNVVTVVDHFSKVNELVISHFDLGSTDSGSSSPITPLSPRYSDMEISIEESSDTTQLLDTNSKSTPQESPHSSFIICHLETDCYEFVITNTWREKLNITLKRTHLEHKQHGIIYSGAKNPVFASWIEVPDAIVVDSKKSVTVIARITPDYDYHPTFSSESSEQSTNIMIATSFLNQLSLPIAIHSTTNRKKTSLKNIISTSSTLSLSLIIRGASALVDGNIIHIDVDNVPINTEKNIEILIAGESRDLQKHIFITEVNPFVEMVEHDMTSVALRLHSSRIGLQSGLILLIDTKNKDFCFIILSASFICNINQLSSLQSDEFLSLVHSERVDGFEEVSSLSQLIQLSSLNSQGWWDVLSSTNTIYMEGISTLYRGYFESHVYAITNRSNVDITAVLFSNKKDMMQLYMLDYSNNNKTKILLVPPHTTRYFTILLIDSDVTPGEESTGYFRLVFSNLRRFFFSFQYHISYMEESFTIRGTEGFLQKELSMQIADNKTTAYPIVNVPRLFLKNKSVTREKYYVLFTASYITTTLQREDCLCKNPFGGKFVELEGNEECEISFDLIVETYLDRIKQYQTINDEQILVIMNCSTHEIKKVLFQVTNSGYFDMFENISLLSASETIFRHCLSIAEIFVQNWIYFPIAITEENVEQVSAILSQSHSEVTTSAFSIELLEDSFLDYKCIMQIIIEVMHDKPEIRHFITNMVTFFIFMYSHPCFSIFINTNTQLPTCLIGWVNELYDIVCQCPVFYPHIGSLLQKLKALC